MERERSTVDSIVGRNRPTVRFADTVHTYDVGVVRGTVVPVHPSTCLFIHSDAPWPEYPK